MFTNRDEVLEKALRIFAKMNYEKASQMEIAKTCGLSKAGLVYYFPFKLDLFKAVVDKYVFDTQHSKNKFNFTANSLSEFIDQYVAGVENTMQRLVQQGGQRQLNAVAAGDGIQCLAAEIGQGKGGQGGSFLHGVGLVVLGQLAQGIIGIGALVPVGAAGQGQERQRRQQQRRNASFHSVSSSEIMAI